MGGLIGFLINHKNILMSRRSLNNYQKKFKFFPVKRIELFLHQKVKLIIANAEAVKRNIIEEGAPKNKVKVIYNGFINPKNKKKESINNFKKKLGLKK